MLNALMTADAVAVAGIADVWTNFRKNVLLAAPELALVYSHWIALLAAPELVLIFAHLNAFVDSAMVFELHCYWA